MSCSSVERFCQVKLCFARLLGLRSGTESALDTRLLQLNAVCDTGHEMIPVVYPIMSKPLIDMLCANFLTVSDNYCSFTS